MRHSRASGNPALHTFLVHQWLLDCFTAFAMTNGELNPSLRAGPRNL